MGTVGTIQAGSIQLLEQGNIVDNALQLMADARSGQYDVGNLGTSTAMFLGVAVEAFLVPDVVQTGDVGLRYVMHVELPEMVTQSALDVPEAQPGEESPDKMDKDFAGRTKPSTLHALRGLKLK